MNPEHNPIDPMFRETLRNYEIIPSEKSWEKIQASIESKPARRLVIWLPMMAASICLLIIAGIIWNEISVGKIEIAKANTAQKRETKTIDHNAKENPSQITQAEDGPHSQEGIIAQEQSPNNITNQSQVTLKKNNNSPQRLQSPSMEKAPVDVVADNKAMLNRSPKMVPIASLPFENEGIEQKGINKVDEKQFIETKVNALANQEKSTKTNKNPLVSIHSNITSEDLLASLEDNSGTFSFGRKWLAVAEKKVIEVSKQIRIPDNLSSIDQIEIIF
ncbi:MAG: hypothetical protein ABI002_05430 [Saprospiraceae bacterium]